jgi:V/A-type H+-transporting ATPase subunit I
MKQIELTVLDRDVDRVIEYLGRRALMQFSRETGETDTPRRSGGALKHIEANLEKLEAAAVSLGLELPAEPLKSSKLPGEEEETLTDAILGRIDSLKVREQSARIEKRKVEETLNEARAFSRLNVPFAELDQLSYLTLRIGRLDVKQHETLKSSLGDRAVIIPLDTETDGGAESSGGTVRILAASSRKGRFALDSELKRSGFIPITISPDYKGIPPELLAELQGRLDSAERQLEAVGQEKLDLREELGESIRRLGGGYRMAFMVEGLKAKLTVTANVYVLSGWVPADSVEGLLRDLDDLTGGRIGALAYNPNELERVRSGKEKVPVSLIHGSIVKGFEPVIFSYGAPLYGTIDPTPFVAFFFTLLFGVMFGDMGQGLVLFLLGFASSARGFRFMARFRKYSTPLVMVGIASMVMGFLDGEVFANEELLVGPTRIITGFLIDRGLMHGEPLDRFIQIMPQKGSISKLFYFFGFTIAIGILLNSVGLVINMINQTRMRQYKRAFFSKTGLAGAFFFWYAVFIGCRVLLGGRFAWFDIAGLVIPILLLIFGPALLNLCTGKRPIAEEGPLVLVIEGLVEVIETISSYFSNTVSFLRVGAFALSHAVLTFIIFTLSEMVHSHFLGPLFSLIIIIFGNAVIILLEGMIVAIQVVRLQYYEFFSKFFTETGVKFTPFRFHGEVES